MDTRVFPNVQWVNGVSSLSLDAPLPWEPRSLGTTLLHLPSPAAAGERGSGGAGERRQAAAGERGAPLDRAGPVFKNVHPTKIFSTPEPVSH